MEAWSGAMVNGNGNGNGERLIAMVGNSKKDAELPLSNECSLVNFMILESGSSG